MFEIKFILHKNITDMQINEIINIKSISWPYSYESQINWIYSNMKNEDIHVLLYLDKFLIAYLNLIKLEFTIDGLAKNGYGIGNVCSKEKGKGWGRELITNTNLYLIQNDQIGLLFCKKILVAFYKHFKWKEIKKKITLSFNNEIVEAMIFNWDDDFQNIEYLGKPF